LLPNGSIQSVRSGKKQPEKALAGDEPIPDYQSAECSLFALFIEALLFGKRHQIIKLAR
jgi:hypothetical protein